MEGHHLQAPRQGVRSSNQGPSIRHVSPEPLHQARSLLLNLSLQTTRTVIVYVAVPDNHSHGRHLLLSAPVMMPRKRQRPNPAEAASSSSAPNGKDKAQAPATSLIASVSEAVGASGEQTTPASNPRPSSQVSFCSDLCLSCTTHSHLYCRCPRLAAGTDRSPGSRKLHHQLRSRKRISSGALLNPARLRILASLSPEGLRTTP